MTTKTQSKPYGCNKSTSKEEVYSDAILPQETKISNKQHNLTPYSNQRKKN